MDLLWQRRKTTSVTNTTQDKILQPSSDGARFNELQVTNDGATILKSIHVSNPAAKVSLHKRTQVVTNIRTRIFSLLLIYQLIFWAKLIAQFSDLGRYFKNTRRWSRWRYYQCLCIDWWAPPWSREVDVPKDPPSDHYRRWATSAKFSALTKCTVILIYST